MAKLDVGCGETHRGTFNLDIKKPCDILADAHYLPFQSKSFDMIISHHVIEHVKNPWEALKEWNRVAVEVLIYTPSALNFAWHTDHYFTWNQQTLANLLKLVFKNVQVDFTVRPVYFGGRLGRSLLPLLLPFLTRMGFTQELRALCS